jgi:outer membrane protein TolC
MMVRKLYKKIEIKILPYVFSAALLIVINPSTSYAQEFYSIQVAAYKNLSNANRNLKKIPKKFKNDSFIHKKSNGLWSVNIFKIDDIKKAKNKLILVKSALGSCFLVKIQTGGSKTKKIDKAKADINTKKENFQADKTKAINFYNATGGMQKYNKSPIAMDIKQYIKKVEESNLDLKIAFKDYKTSVVDFNQKLNDYNWKLNFEANIGESYDGSNHFDRGANLSLTKILYNGGAQTLLSKEYEIARYLEKANLIKQNDLIALSAISAYALKLYYQQMNDFIEEQLNDREKLFKSVEKLYQKGSSVSKYDYLTEKRELSNLKIESLLAKNQDRKSDIEFRNLGRIYTTAPIKLSRFDVDYNIYFPQIQKKAIVNNSTMIADRYGLKDAFLTYEVSNSENSPLINFEANAGVSKSSNQTNTKAGYYNIGLKLTYPILDGGIKRTNLLYGRLRALRAKLKLQKDSEEVIKKLALLYEDYNFYKKEEKRLKEILKYDQERLDIAKKKYLKGMGDYVSIRDSWSDLIDTKKQLLNAYVMKNKIILDMLIFAGEKL